VHFLKVLHRFAARCVGRARERWSPKYRSSIDTVYYRHERWCAYLTGMYVKCSSLSDENFSSAFLRRITQIAKKILSDTRSVHNPKKRNCLYLHLKTQTYRPHLVPHQTNERRRSTDNVDRPRYSTDKSTIN
jgi:hypothetical protein